MTITKERITDLIISWLDKDPYSKKHWAAVSKELLKKQNNDKDLAILEMAKALESFHQLYKAKVVKPDNLLDELLSNCFELVDWGVVAGRWY